MRQRLRLWLSLFFALMLFAALQGAYGAPLATFPVVTFTPTVTATFTATNTPIATLTFTSSPTYTPTLTLTPEPLIEVVLFILALVPSDLNDPYFYSLRSLSADGIETIIGTNGNTQ